MCFYTGYICNILANYPSSWDGKRLIFMNGLMKINVYQHTICIKKKEADNITSHNIILKTHYMYNKIRELVYNHLRFHQVM